MTRACAACLCLQLGLHSGTGESFVPQPNQTPPTPQRRRRVLPAADELQAHGRTLSHRGRHRGGRFGETLPWSECIVGAASCCCDCFP